MNQIQLTPAQQAALSLSQHIVVTAGAGTGKTEVLIQRIIKILSQVNHINQVLAITYTDKAAGEIKHRVYRAILEKLNTAQGDERAKFERMREQFLKNYISTIHSFCAAVIRRFPQEIEELDPDFGILEGYEQRKLLRESIETLLDSIATNKEHPLYGDLRNVLRHRNKGIVMSMLAELVNRRQEVGTNVTFSPQKSWIEMVSTLAESEILMRQEQLASFYSQNVLNKLKEMPQIQNILARLEGYVPQKSAEKDNAYTKRQIVLDAFEGNPPCKIPPVPPLLKGGNKGGKSSPAELVEELFDSQGNVRGFGRLGSQTVWGKETIVILRNDFEELGNSLLPYRDQLQINFDPEVDESSIKVLKGLARLAERAIQNYQEAKQNNRVLDFSDLELYAARLLENPTILQTLQNQIRYILVDEFQDTNQFQWNLVKLLAMKPNTDQLTSDKLLIVGDEKQSIYSFRGGDVEVCDMAKEELLACNLTHHSSLITHHSFGIIGFNVNFRSRPNLLYFFNRFFRHLLTKTERYEAEPQDLCYKQGDAFVFPENPIESTEQGTVEQFITYVTKGGRGSDLDLPAATAAQAGEEEGIADDLKEAMMIAARLRAIMDGEMAEKYRDLGEKLHRRDKAVGILFRRRTKQKLYEEALRAYGVPYVVAKGRGFYEQQEILDIANVLRVLTDPRQDIALIGVLRSPLIGCSDNALFQVWKFGYHQITKLPNYHFNWQDGKMARWQDGKPFCPLAPLPPCPLPLDDFSERDAQALQKARALFDEWSRLKNHISISELIVRIVRDTGAMMTYARGSDGVQTVSNVEKLIDMARKFESQGFYTLADFTEYLQDQIEAEEEEGEADLPEGGGVQLMTVHQAKGLQFPMVIVPDTDSYFRYDEGMLIGKINGQTEVGLRITKSDGDEADTAIRQILRAENRKKTIAEQKRLLYVAFTRAENHLIICQKIVEDSQPFTSFKGKPKPIAKANCWGDWIRCILEEDEFSFVEDIIYPTAELSSEEFGIRNSECGINAEAVDFDPALLYPEFIDPLKTAVTVSQKIQSGEGARGQEGKRAGGQNGEESYSGLHAAEIGILVHRILSQNILPDLRYHQAIQQLSQRVRAEAFLEGWTPTERNMQTVVKEILNTQKWIDTQAIDPNRCYRNVEFEYETDSETIRGSIDLLYYNTELPGWVIVDFKTDRIPSEDMFGSLTNAFGLWIETTIEERGYKQQMDYYCQAAENILSERIQEKIWFFTKFEKAYKLRET